MRERKLYLILAVITLVVAAADITYFNRLEVAEAEAATTAQTEPATTAQAEPAQAAPVAREAADAADDAPSPDGADRQPQVVDECSYDDSMMVVDDFERLISMADPYLGALDAPVKVLEFFDPNCGHCATMHPVMKAMVDRHGDEATFYMIPFVLWPYSLDQAEALYVAAQDGKYFEMLEGQYARQKAGGLSIPEIVEIANEIGLDGAVVGQRVERAMNRRSILERRQAIVDLGVRGTPTVMINGRFVETASKTPTCLSELITEAHAGATGG